MELKVPLPRIPNAVSAFWRDKGAVLSWQAVQDCNGNAVAGYNVYRSTAAGGFFAKINTELISATEYIDTDALGAAEVGADPTYYYTITSVDDDGDESAQTLPISPTSIGSAASKALPCFIGSVSQAMPQRSLWVLILLAICLLIGKWYKVYGTRGNSKKNGLRCQCSGVSAERSDRFESSVLSTQS